MGCIRVDKITEYLCEPLRKCLKDEDPYVRKTAAVCVAKLYDINAQLVEDQGFLDQLKDLLSDSNPMVPRFLLRLGLLFFHSVSSFDCIPGCCECGGGAFGNERDQYQRIDADRNEFANHK